MLMNKKQIYSIWKEWKLFLSIYRDDLNSLKKFSNEENFFISFLKKEINENSTKADESWFNDIMIKWHYENLKGKCHDNEN